jgi:catechol 2,3-dioxygenase-like lactoylglutathione lyase family enzyme
MTKTLVTGVDFVTVPARDLDASVHFYGTVLGLPPVKQWGEMPAHEFRADPCGNSLAIHHRYAKD